MKFNKPFKDNEPTSPLRNRTSIDVVDNFKKIQNYILTNNNAVPKPVYNNGGAFSRDNIINYEPGTSKLKKILMNSKDENQPAKEVKGKQKLFLCSDCKEYFSRLHLFQHIKSVHNKFTCLYCYGFFVSVDSLEKHLSKKHKIQNSAFLTGDQLTKYLEDTEQSIEKKLIQAVCCKCGDMLNENFLDHSCGLATLKQPEAVRELTPALINNLPDAEMDLNPPLSLQSIANNIQMPSSQAPANSILSSILSYPSSLSISSLHQTIIPTLPPIPTISPVKPVKEVVNEKLLVPKLKLSIPKVFQQNIESEEESEESESEDEQSPSKHQKTYSSSGDETDDEEEEEDEIFQQQAKILEEMNKVQNQIDSTMCKKLPKLQIKLSTKSIQPALKQEEPIVSPPPTPVHTPSIKIKIKNITSQILEPVIEQICEAGEPMNLVELTDKSLMDLDDSVGDVKTEDSLLQIKDEKPVIGNAIMIDNVSVVPAGDDILPIDIGQLDEGLDKIPIRTFMKICLKNAIPTCLYCNHARKIVVNGKSLAIHFITNHRFQVNIWLKLLIENVAKYFYYFRPPLTALPKKNLNQRKSSPNSSQIWTIWKTVTSTWTLSTIKMRTRRREILQFRMINSSSASSVASRHTFTKNSIYTTERCIRRR